MNILNLLLFLFWIYCFLKLIIKRDADNIEAGVSFIICSIYFLNKLINN